MSQGKHLKPNLTSIVVDIYDPFKQYSYANWLNEDTHIQHIFGGSSWKWGRLMFIIFQSRQKTNLLFVKMFANKNNDGELIQVEIDFERQNTLLYFLLRYYNPI